MAAKRDYYEVLGVDREATPQQIKAAYRKLAVRYHPDRNSGDKSAEAKFKAAAEAYAVLSDADKRARYDRFGHQGVGAGGFSGFDPDTFGDFADILGDFFGFGFGDRFGRRRRSSVRHGADLRYELGITLEEAAFGLERTLEIPRLEGCETCSGSGSAGGAAPAPCSACGGHGQVRFTQGFFTGEGEHGSRGGQPGDLYVDIVVAPHERLRRQGADVMSEETVSFSQAVLGAEVEVETLHGKAPLEIKPGTPHGAQLRLRGKGIERLGGRGRGDHVVFVAVEIPDPKALGDAQIELIRRLAELEGRPVREDRKVLDRMRDLFG